MAVSQGTLPVQVSEPDVIQRHNISDEELSMLCEGRKDFVLEFLWVSIGGLVGSLPAALTAMLTYSDATAKMPMDDLIQIVIFWVAAALTVALSIVAYRRGKRALDLQTKIRNRSSGQSI